MRCTYRYTQRPVSPHTAQTRWISQEGLCKLIPVLCYFGWWISMGRQQYGESEVCAVVTGCRGNNLVNSLAWFVGVFWLAFKKILIRVVLMENKICVKRKTYSINTLLRDFPCGHGKCHLLTWTKFEKKENMSKLLKCLFYIYIVPVSSSSVILNHCWVCLRWKVYF